MLGFSEANKTEDEVISILINSLENDHDNWKNQSMIHEVIINKAETIAIVFESCYPACINFNSHDKNRGSYKLSTLGTKRIRRAVEEWKKKEIIRLMSKE